MARISDGFSERRRNTVRSQIVGALIGTVIGALVSLAVSTFTLKSELAAVGTEVRNLTQRHQELTERVVRVETTLMDWRAVPAPRR